MHPTCFFYPFSLIHTFSIAVLHIVPAHAYFYRHFRVVRTAHWHTVWTLIRALIWEMKLLNPSNILVSNIGKFPKRFYLVGQLLSICCLITYFWPETCWPAFFFSPFDISKRKAAFIECQGLYSVGIGLGGKVVQLSFAYQQQCFDYV